MASGISYSIQRIPLDGIPGKFRITLADKPYILRFEWCEYGKGDGVDGQWIMDIYDGDENPIVCGTPLRLGGDMLGQYTYLGIGGGLVLKSFNGEEDPTFANINTNYQLLFVRGVA